MRKLSFLVFITLIGISSMLYGQGTTTSGMNGKISSGQDILPGANIVATHLPTGTQYGTISDEKGWYRLPNLNVGGPYKIVVSFMGYDTYNKEDIYLTLGQTLQLYVDMKETAVDINEVKVIAKKNDLFDGNRTGSQTVVESSQISALPTISRSLADFTRMTPQAKLYGGGISIAGTNNRYNSIFIDGAVNNDVFGLTSSGTNGGQLGITPISIDAIEQFQVTVAPYDVKQGGFAGGGINAVTKRGTNNLHGSVYMFMRNENFAGKTPTDNPDIERTKLSEFKSNTYGLTVGGPIIQNKLFFFINAEIQRDETPIPYDLADYTGNLNDRADSINMIVNKLKNEYNYDPGSYQNVVKTNNSDKFLARIDWNLSQKHKLSVRHHYTKGIAIYPYTNSSKTQIVFDNNWINFKSITNSSSLQLKSRFSNSLSNDLILGLTSVKDDRDQNGSPFPHVTIKDGLGSIIFGSERYSAANELNQRVFTITDNLEFYYGIHNITIGTHNEFYKMYNLYIRENFGNYTFANPDAFLNNGTAASYARTYSLVDDVTGDGSKAAADFTGAQLGAYLQDEIQITNDLRVTLGIRMDIPMFLEKPRKIEQFDTTLAKITAAGYDLEGAKSGEMPKSKPLISPRFGFNYDLLGKKTTQIRGGVGVFTSRIPLVWPGGVYSNCGLILGGISATNVEFRSDWNNQYTATDLGATLRVPSGEINLFSEDFKFPQVLKASLAIDQKLPLWGLVGTAEFIYSKTLNNILYQNVNLVTPEKNLTGYPDDRPIYPGTVSGSGSLSVRRIESAYSAIYLASNTNKGSSMNITFQIQKPVQEGFSGGVAYTYGTAKSINDGLSSQNSSQWRYIPNVNGKNSLDLAYSDFDLGHRVVAYTNYRIEYLNHAATTISVYYNGQSGDRYSYVYLNGFRMMRDDAGGSYNDVELIWIPKNQSEINLVPIRDTEGNITTTVEQQWNDLDQFIKDDDYLSENRGGYCEKGGARLPFVNMIDIKIMQEFFLKVKNTRHTLQVSFDIYNVGNMLNEDWGRSYYISNNKYPLIEFAGFETDGTTPTFVFRKPKDIKSVSDAGIGGSRWYAQLGVRYIF